MTESDPAPAVSAEARRMLTVLGNADWWSDGRRDAERALSVHIAGLEAEVARLSGAMDASWRKVISYPFPQVCKHLVAGNILSDMEQLGFAVTKEVAEAVVFAQDEDALAHPPLRFYSTKDTTHA